MGIIGASSALCLSDIPFDGPVSATRLGYIDGEIVVNPTFAQLEESKLDLVVAGTRDAIAMVEAGASEVSEEVIIQAVKRGQEVNQVVIGLQQELMALAGKPKMSPKLDGYADDELIEKVASAVGDRLHPTIFTGKEKGERDGSVDNLVGEVAAQLSEDYSRQSVGAAFEALLKKEVRSGIVLGGLRPDGRGPKEIRPISCETSVLPRTHGSGLFTRGQTQVLTIATLGSMAENQKLGYHKPGGEQAIPPPLQLPPLLRRRGKESRRPRPQGGWTRSPGGARPPSRRTKRRGVPLHHTPGIGVP